MTIIYICIIAILFLLVIYLIVWNEKLNISEKAARAETDRLIEKVVSLSRNTETVIAEYKLTDSDYLLSPQKMEKRAKQRLLSNLALKIVGAIDDTPAFDESTKTYYYEITILK